MDEKQQFRLKWNNYHVNIASSFDTLRLDEDFVDVTIACDGFQAKVHKVVLSACSPYFQQMLKVSLLLLHCLGNIRLDIAEETCSQ